MTWKPTPLRPAAWAALATATQHAKEPDADSSGLVDLNGLDEARGATKP